MGSDGDGAAGVKLMGCAHCGKRMAATAWLALALHLYRVAPGPYAPPDPCRFSGVAPGSGVLRPVTPDRSSMPSEFDPHDDEQAPEPGERPEGVIVVSTAPTEVRFVLRDDVAVPEGMVCLGVYLGERLIAQDARPPAVAERLVQYGGGMAKLVYATAPDGGGLTGYLYALLPAEGLTDLLAGLEEDEDEEEAPWTASARAYEAAVGDEDEEDDEEDDIVDAELEGDDDEEEGDEDEEEEGEAQVLVPLGAIKRVYRSHPDSVEAEAADVLAHIVAGEVTTVDAQTVEQFLKGL